MLTICSVASCVPLLIQQKVNGSNFFNRSWAEFKVGFNESSGNYWLGNELLSQVTLNRHYKVRFDFNKNGWYHAEYSTFRVLSEPQNYTLLVFGFSGNWHDALTMEHNGMKFTTYDRDNDLLSSGNCAVQNGGGFWYNDCGRCGVNGAGQHFKWDFYTLQSTRMWLQCK